MIRYVFCDVDGCLLPEESAPWDLRPVMQLIAWVRRTPEHPLRPQVVLCTGRPQPYVEALMKLLDVRLPAICESGAVLYTLHDNYGRYGPGVTAEDVRKLRQLQLWLETELLPAQPPGDAVLQFGKMAQLSVYSPRHAVLEALAPKVREKAATLELELDVHTSVYYLNISLLHASKGAAATALLKEWGATREEAAAIGDTEGDLSLREAAGFFACPANGRPAIRAVADYVAKGSLTEGALEILDLIEHRNS